MEQKFAVGEETAYLFLSTSDDMLFEVIANKPLSIYHLFLLGKPELLDYYCYIFCS